MVLCLVTLTDLQTRRAGLSASAELLVLRTVDMQYAPLQCSPSHLGILSKKTVRPWPILDHSNAVRTLSVRTND